MTDGDAQPSSHPGALHPCPGCGGGLTWAGPLPSPPAPHGTSARWDSHGKSLFWWCNRADNGVTRLRGSAAGSWICAVYNISCKTTATLFPKSRLDADTIERSPTHPHNAASWHCSGGRRLLGAAGLCHAQPPAAGGVGTGKRLALSRGRVPRPAGRKAGLAGAGEHSARSEHGKALGAASRPGTWLSAFWPRRKISSPVLAPVGDLGSARDTQGKRLEAWQGLQGGRGCPTPANSHLGPSKYWGGFARWGGLVGQGSAPCPPVGHAGGLPAAEVGLVVSPSPATPSGLPGANRRPPDGIDFPPKGGGENCLNYNSSTLHFSIISRA